MFFDDVRVMYGGGHNENCCNHLACCYFVWLSLKIVAKKTLRTLYRVRADLFCDFLKIKLT
jgi:hypothetical protein